MRSRLELTIVALIAVCAGRPLPAQSPSSCAALAEAKRTTYGFHPAQLSASEQRAKSVAMDRFWNLAKASGSDGLVCVSNLIAAEQADTYFLFDAASLLAAFDKSGASDAAVVRALSRTDLSDVDPQGFIELALQVSKRGGDIGPAAHNYMNANSVTAYLPAHGGYKLDRVSGAILLYGRMPPDVVDRYLAEEVRSTNAETRNAAAIVWSLNMTEASFRGLAALGDMKGFSSEAREHVRTVRRQARVPVNRPAKYTRTQILGKIAAWPDSPDSPAEAAALENASYATLTADDLPAVREARRRVIAGVSDEAVEAYNEVSRMLMNLVNVLDMYKDHRIH